MDEVAHRPYHVMARDPKNLRQTLFFIWLYLVDKAFLYIDTVPRSVLDLS